MRPLCTGARHTRRAPRSTAASDPPLDPRRHVVRRSRSPRQGHASGRGVAPPHGREQAAPGQEAGRSARRPVRGRIPGQTWPDAARRLTARRCERRGSTQPIATRGAGDQGSSRTTRVLGPGNAGVAQEPRGGRSAPGPIAATAAGPRGPGRRLAHGQTPARSGGGTRVPRALWPSSAAPSLPGRRRPGWTTTAGGPPSSTLERSNGSVSGVAIDRHRCNGSPCPSHMAHHARDRCPPWTIGHGTPDLSQHASPGPNPPPLRTRTGCGPNAGVRRPSTQACRSYGRPPRRPGAWQETSKAVATPSPGQGSSRPSPGTRACGPQGAAAAVSTGAPEGRPRPGGRTEG